MLQGTQAMIWFYTRSSNFPIAHKINWKMNCRVKALLDMKYYYPVKYQISPSPKLDLWRACDLCIPGALPRLGSKLRCVNTGGEQLSFCNSWTSAPLPSLHLQTTKMKNDSSVRGCNFFSHPWTVTTNNALWRLPMGSVRVAQSIGTQLFPSLQQTKGHRNITATSSPI